VNDRPKVFLSYSHGEGKEKAWARKLAEELMRLDCSVFFDEWELRPGENVAEVIERGLRNSDTFIAVLSRGSETRPNLLFELGVAIGSGKRLIPVVAKDVDRSKVPFEIRSRRYLPKGSPDETARRLVEAIQQTGEPGETALLAGGKER
jgi:nucleoside 2-deoxyribosyltransferase